MVNIGRDLPGLSMHGGPKGPGPGGNRHADQEGRWESPVQQLIQAARPILEQMAAGTCSLVPEAGAGWRGCQKRPMSSKYEEVQSACTISKDLLVGCSRIFQTFLIIKILIQNNTEWSSLVV